MMDEELKLDLLNVRDDPRFERGGGVVREKTYTFYLGKHGPFTFRTPIDPFDPSAFDRHVADLRAHLRSAQRT